MPHAGGKEEQFTALRNHDYDDEITGAYRWRLDMLFTAAGHAYRRDAPARQLGVPRVESEPM